MFPKFSRVAFLFLGSFFFLQCQTDKPSIALQPIETKVCLENRQKVAPPISQESITKSSKKYVYITFDDGPNKGTSHVIQSLQREKVPATLFLVGSHIKGSKAQERDFEIIIQDTLFQIANHSYSHANNKFSEFYKDSVKVLEDFNRMNDSLNRKLMIARTPGRNIWRLDSIKETDLKSSEKAADYLAKNEFILVGWDVEWKSDSTYKVKETGKEIMAIIDSTFSNNRVKTENHLVLLTHDQYFRDENSVKELDDLLQILNKREDIELRKMKDYPGIKPNIN